MKIIDFHTHPFLDDGQNICSHKEITAMTVESTRAMYDRLGVSRICGSVIDNETRGNIRSFDDIRRMNETALELRERFGGFYVPGFHVHPDFPEESCREIERMESLGVRLIGELVPYMHGWRDYSCTGFSQILDEAEAHHMVVSFHSTGEDEMDRMVQSHPGVIFVAAHPGEYGAFCRHMKRMAMSANYYLDTSGYGIFRHAMLRHAIDLFGPERFLFGSDYPTCNPGMYVGGVMLDELITEEERRLIMAGNAARLLGL